MIPSCMRCKGSNPRLYCGRSYCPLIAKSEARFKVGGQIGKAEFSGSSPTPFVGRYGYPHVQVGILSVEEKDSSLHDAPRSWAASEYQIPKIVELRSSLVNSQFKADVRAQDRLVDISQEVGMASKPVEMEVKLDRAPVFRLTSDPMAPPMGPTAALKTVDITANPKIPQRVQKVFDDIDLKSASAMQYLYKHDFDEQYLSRLLSIGTLGVKPERKMVPTRWSITAVDDSLGKALIAEIRQCAQTDFAAYLGGYLGNWYMVMTLPQQWSYELFEMYLPKASWNVSDEVQFSTDYEPYDGRKNYAESTAGGYYAARLPILERLKATHRQGGVLALRFITGDYYMPLGVWVVREATRKAMESAPIRFDSQYLMLDYARHIATQKFGIDISRVLEQSILLRERRDQKRLTAFF